MKKLTDSEASALYFAADKLGVVADDLAALINFESAFNPLAKNKITGARGLIQFLHSTARSLGYKDADDLVTRNPTIELQLKGPVLAYLSQFKPFSQPYPQSLYLSVFYPAYRYKSPDTAFSDSVRNANPGINFVRDYVAWVEKKKLNQFLKKYSPVGFLFPIAVTGAIVFIKHLKKKRGDYGGKGNGGI